MNRLSWPLFALLTLTSLGLAQDHPELKLPVPALQKLMLGSWSTRASHFASGPTPWMRPGNDCSNCEDTNSTSQLPEGNAVIALCPLDLRQTSEV